MKKKTTEEPGQHRTGRIVNLLWQLSLGEWARTFGARALGRIKRKA